MYAKLLELYITTNNKYWVTGTEASLLVKSKQNNKGLQERSRDHPPQFKKPSHVSQVYFELSQQDDRCEI